MDEQTARADLKGERQTARQWLIETIRKDVEEYQRRKREEQEEAE